MTILIGIAAGMIKNREQFDPALLEMVENVTFGSFTPSMKIGNKGTTFWFDDYTGMSMNAIGLTNQGLFNFLNNDLVFILNHDWSSTRLRVSLAPLQSGDCKKMIKLLNRHSFRTYIDEVEVNAACPNHRDERGLHPVLAHDPDAVERLLQECQGCKLPLALKIAPNTKIGVLKKIVELCMAYNVVTLVSGNTLARSSVVDGVQKLSVDRGGMAGRPLLKYSLRQTGLLTSLIKRLGANIKLIGCGGVMDASAVMSFEEEGADEVQIATLFYQYGIRGVQDLLAGLPE